MPKVALKRSKLPERVLYKVNLVEPIYDRVQTYIRDDIKFVATVFRTAETPTVPSGVDAIQPVEFRIEDAKGKIVEGDVADSLGMAVDFIQEFSRYRNLIAKDIA